MISGEPDSGRPRRMDTMLRNQCGGSSGMHVVWKLGVRSEGVRIANKDTDQTHMS